MIFKGLQGLIGVYKGVQGFTGVLWALLLDSGETIWWTTMNYMPDLASPFFFRWVFLTFLFIKALTIDLGVEFADPHYLVWWQRLPEAYAHVRYRLTSSSDEKFVGKPIVP